MVSTSGKSYTPPRGTSATLHAEAEGVRAKDRKGGAAGARVVAAPDVPFTGAVSIGALIACASKSRVRGVLQAVEGHVQKLPAESPFPRRRLTGNLT